MKLQAAENNMATLKTQYETATTQADKAKKAVQQNAMRVSELAAKRMELLGSLEAAKMQESVNQAVDAMSNMSDYEAPSLEKIEDKIERRKAEAMAKAELREATPEGLRDGAQGSHQHGTGRRQARGAEGGVGAQQLAICKD